MSIENKWLRYNTLTIFASVAMALNAADDTQLNMAKERLADYDVAGARECVGKYLAQGGRRAKPTAEMKASAEAVNDDIDRVELMLGRVERVLVIDSLTVPNDAFVNYYRLAAEAGHLHSGAELDDEIGPGHGNVAYVSPDSRLMLWARTDSAGVQRLVEASKLSDGTWDKPTYLEGRLNQGGNVDYPYLLVDGNSLYFASDGSTSLGGLDIMMSRYDGEKWLEPQNVGMPFNSPYDDYMMAIDESTGIGWWATDRNQIADSVTIYMFRPNEVRENYLEGTDGIASLAKLSSLRDTWGDQAEVDALRAKLQGLESSVTMRQRNKNKEFTLSLGDGRIYFNLQDFKSSEARRAMEDYLILSDELRLNKDDLRKLRAKYASGDPSDHDDILLMERRVLEQTAELRQLRNNAIMLETGQR